jgi:uncharacterized protein YndB with AHSA1/START domain
MKNEPIVLKRTYNASPKRVWEAITQLEQMQQWYFPMLTEFEPVVGFETRFDVAHNDKNFPHIWKVVEVIPGRKISYEWKFSGYPGNSLLTMEISPAGEGTHLVLTHDKVETFEDDKHPELSKNNFVQGWTYFMDESLKSFVEADTE